MTAADIPLADQIAEVKRELAMRENVYPKLGNYIVDSLASLVSASFQPRITFKELTA